MGEFGRQIGREGHGKKTNIAFLRARHDNAMLVFSFKLQASSDKLHSARFNLAA
jgi:hypothetical protein